MRYQSTARLFGMPLLAIATGADAATGQTRGTARGLIAIGDIACGGIAIGGLAAGVVSVGGIAVGGVSIGGCALGVLGLGGIAVAVLALAGLAIGVFAHGGLALALVTPVAPGDAELKAFLDELKQQTALLQSIQTPAAAKAHNAQVVAETRRLREARQTYLDMSSAARCSPALFAQLKGSIDPWEKEAARFVALKFLADIEDDQAFYQSVTDVASAKTSAAKLGKLKEHGIRREEKFSSLLKNERGHLDAVMIEQLETARARWTLEHQRVEMLTTGP